MHVLIVYITSEWFGWVQVDSRPLPDPQSCSETTCSKGLFSESLCPSGTVRVSRRENVDQTNWGHDAAAPFTCWQAHTSAGHMTHIASQTALPRIMMGGEGVVVQGGKVHTCLYALWAGSNREGLKHLACPLHVQASKSLCYSASECPTGVCYTEKCCKARTQLKCCKLAACTEQFESEFMPDKYA